MSKLERKNTIGRGPASVRLLIADDQPKARHGLQALLTALSWTTLGHSDRPPFEIVGETGTGKQVADQVQALCPDVILMDLYARTESFPGPKPVGLKAIQTIKSRWPAVRVVVLTMYATDRRSALWAGADAFLLKGCSMDDLLEAVLPDGASGR